MIADLTDHNANAFYELGIRHNEGKPTVHLIVEGQEAPFDLDDQKNVRYRLESPDFHKQARAALAAWEDGVPRVRDTDLGEWLGYNLTNISFQPASMWSDKLQFRNDRLPTVSVTALP